MTLTILLEMHSRLVLVEVDRTGRGMDRTNGAQMEYKGAQWTEVGR